MLLPLKRGFFCARYPPGPIQKGRGHVKALGYCNAGLRKWFPRDGVSFDDFRKDGVTTDWLRATGDAMAIRLAEAVEQREQVA